MKQVLVYWKEDEIQAALVRGSLPHAGSGQLERLRVGDRAWICGRVSAAPELFTIGFITVNDRLPRDPAMALMRQRYPGHDIWDAPWHIFAKPGEECATRSVSLVPIYAKLAFESKTSPRLVLDEGGHPNPMRLQTNRVLTTFAAKAILDRWNAARR